MMKIELKIVGLVVVLGCLAGASYGSTIGFVGAAGVNVDIPAAYGSNIAADGAGWTVSDGSGATPDIALEWSVGDGFIGDWEFHNSGVFDFLEANSTGGTWDTSPANAIVQIDKAPTFIKFSVAAGQALVLNSVDVGHASDQHENHGVYGFDLTLVRDSDSATVWTGSSTAVGAADVGVAETAAETVAIDYTGALGEDYTLTFTRYDEGVPSLNQTTAASGIDNLSFSQTSEPPTVITVRPTDDARLYDVTVQDGVANGVANAADQHLNVGDWTSDTLSSAIFVVELPDFPAGESIDSAEMGWFLNRITTSGSQPNLQVDLFFKDTGVVELSDYNTVAEASMLNFMTPASTVLSTYTWSDSALVSALQGVYNGGTTPSLSNAVFRLRWQGSLPIASDLDQLEDAYNIATVDHATVSRRPALTFALVSAGYTGFTDLYGITGEANSAPEEDYDGDGQLNVYEYGLGGDPTDDNDVGTEPVFSYGLDDTVSFANVVLTDSNADITYIVEQTEDLVFGSWTNSGWNLVTTNTTADPEFDEVEHRINGSDKGELFIRLKITQP